MLGEKLGTATGKLVLRRRCRRPWARRERKARSAAPERCSASSIRRRAAMVRAQAGRRMIGTGQGIYMGKGGELATWTGQGVGTLLKGGGASFQGAIFLYSSRRTGSV